MHESIVFCSTCTCRSKETSRSLSHLLMSFLLLSAVVGGCSMVVCSAHSQYTSRTFLWQTSSLITTRFADKMRRSLQRRQVHSSADRVVGESSQSAGCPLPSRLEGSGSVMSYPSGVRDGAPHASHHHITLIVCTPYYVNLNNNTFQLKVHYSLFIYVNSQQKRTESHLQLSNLQCCHFEIVILRNSNHK